MRRDDALSERNYDVVEQEPVKRDVANAVYVVYVERANGDS